MSSDTEKYTDKVHARTVTKTELRTKRWLRKQCSNDILVFFAIKLKKVGSDQKIELII